MYEIFLKNHKINEINLCVPGRTECVELQIKQYKPSWIFQQ